MISVHAWLCPHAFLNFQIEINFSRVAHQFPINVLTITTEDIKVSPLRWNAYNINLMIPIILYGYLHIFEFKYNLSEFRLFLLLVDVVDQIYFPLFRKSKLWQ